MSANFGMINFSTMLPNTELYTAARELSLTQPSVTKVIKKLESQLGCQLCYSVHEGRVAHRGGRDDSAADHVRFERFSPL